MKTPQPQSDFWSDFAARYWEQSPLVADSPVQAITNTKDIFTALLTYAERCRKGIVSDIELRWLFNHQETKRPRLGTRHDYRKYLAHQQDNSLDGYDRRLTSEGITSYFLQLADYHIYDSEIWNRIREFTTGLYEKTCMPGQKAWCDVVIGRYDCTPFGVHLDGASNFAFGIEGTKTIHLWKPEFYQREMASRDPYDYQPYLSQATTLEITPGKMVYWPSQYWHVAEADGDFSVVLNVAFYVKGSAVEPLLDSLSAQLRARLGENDSISRYPFNRTQPLENSVEIPSSLLHAADALKRIAEGSGLEHALAVIWLQKLTGLGFRRAILPQSHSPLCNHAMIRVDPKYPILYLRLSDNTLVCSANGHYLKTTSHPNVIELLRRLNSGRAARVGDLVSSYADGFVYDTESIRGLLETFVTWYGATLAGSS
jgi:50S ribosomal protein L16 3-hydroxylase